MIFASKSRILIVFCTKLHVFRAFSASYSCLSGRIGPGGARGILFGRGASSIAGATAAWCAVGAAARIRVYGRQVGIPDTFKGWPPGLLSSTTGEQIDGVAHDLQAGGCSPQRPKQTDDTTGSPCSPSDTFRRGIVQLLGDRRNLGRFRAIAGQWRATFSEGWPPGLLASTTKADRRHNGRPAQSLRYFRVWGLFGFWEIGGIWGGSVRLRDNGGRHSSRAGRPSCWPQQVQGRGLRTAVVFPACFYMPNLAPLCMVWGGVISNEDITAKTRCRGNRNDPGILRSWGFPQPFPYRMQTATRAGRLSFVCRAGVCRYGYGTATALRICFSTAERLVSRRAVCML